jgi:hypothetical protein
MVVKASSADVVVKELGKDGERRQRGGFES